MDLYKQFLLICTWLWRYLPYVRQHVRLWSIFWPVVFKRVVVFFLVQLFLCLSPYWHLWMKPSLITCENPSRDSQWLAVGDGSTEVNRRLKLITANSIYAYGEINCNCPWMQTVCIKCWSAKGNHSISNCTWVAAMSCQSTHHWFEGGCLLHRIARSLLVMVMNPFTFENWALWLYLFNWW